MNIKITVRKLEVPDRVKTYVKAAFARLEKFNAKMQSVEVVLKAEDREICCEVVINLDFSGALVVEVSADTVDAAIDLALKKCIRQLKRDKERVVSKVRKQANKAKSQKDE